MPHSNFYPEAGKGMATAQPFHQSLDFGKIGPGDKVTLLFTELTDLVILMTHVGQGGSGHCLPRLRDGWLEIFLHLSLPSDRGLVINKPVTNRGQVVIYQKPTKQNPKNYQLNISGC
jgi:hypothetical protein